MDALFQKINGYLGSVLFFDVMPGEGSMPFILTWLIAGANDAELFLTGIITKMWRFRWPEFS